MILCSTSVFTSLAAIVEEVGRGLTVVEVRVPAAVVARAAVVGAPAADVRVATEVLVLVPARLVAAPAGRTELEAAHPTIASSTMPTARRLPPVCVRCADRPPDMGPTLCQPTRGE